MNKDGWHALVTEAVLTDQNVGFSDALDSIIVVLMEQEEAKNVLRNKGYGWTGLSLLETVKEEVPLAKKYEGGENESKNHK